MDTVGRDRDTVGRDRDRDTGFRDTGVRDERSLKKTGCGWVSWSAIIAGAITAFALSILINLLNAGLNLVPFPGFFQALAGTGVGGFIWLIICSIVIMFLAGLLAGAIVHHVAGACSGFIHGFLAWSLGTLLLLVLVPHLAGSSTTGAGAGAAGAAAANAAANTVAASQGEPSNTLGSAGENTETATNQVAAAGNQMATAVQNTPASNIGFLITYLLGAIAAGIGGVVGTKTGTSGTTRTTY
jgi:hypothetical protein